MNPSSHPTERFGSRVDDYRRWRPGYPPEVVPWLVKRCGLSIGDPVADVGSGTGLFSRELLAARLRVQAIEPNGPMRAAAEAEFAGDSNFLSVNGTAESTGLADASVSLVGAAQAFHWFDPVLTRREFARILKPRGHVALIWNVRRDDSLFLVGYEALLREHAPEYSRSGKPVQADERVVSAFFAPGLFQQASFAYEQQFDRLGLRGRLLSSSYAPMPGMPGHEAMMAALDCLFEEHQRQARVTFGYVTRVFVGRLRDQA
jgi:SAM-dependent methyltransferase